MVVEGVVTGTHEPWSFLDSVSAHFVVEIVVTDVVDGVVVNGVVLGTQEPCSFLDSVSAQLAVVVVVVVI